MRLIYIILLGIDDTVCKQYENRQLRALHHTCHILLISQPFRNILLYALYVYDIILQCIQLTLRQNITSLQEGVKLQQKPFKCKLHELCIYNVDNSIIYRL